MGTVKIGGHLLYPALPALGNLNFNHILGGQNDTPAAESVGTDGGHDNQPGRRLRYGTSRGQVVAGGASGSGDDHTIGAVIHQKLSVYIDMNLDNLQRAAPGDHNVIQGPILHGPSILIKNLAIQHHAAFGENLSGHQPVQRLIQTSGLYLRHIAQSPQIYADQGNIGFLHIPCGLQHGTIASQNNHTAGIRRSVVPAVHVMMIPVPLILQNYGTFMPVGLQVASNPLRHHHALVLMTVGVNQKMLHPRLFSAYRRLPRGIAPIGICICLSAMPAFSVSRSSMLHVGVLHCFSNLFLPVLPPGKAVLSQKQILKPCFRLLFRQF